MAENPAERIARSYFESEKVVSHYFGEGQRVGLWNSEEFLFKQVFSVSERLLDLGCGTGRIAFGLEAMGYKQVEAADFSTGMIEGAKQIAESLGSKLTFQCADARYLPWKSGCFDGVIFGFNGFFMIPGGKERLRALTEIYRVLKSGGRFIFTGHDRLLSNQKRHWSKEEPDWTKNVQDKRKTDFGDVIEDTELGTMFIHCTDQAETETLMKSVGFTHIESWSRRELSNETARVRNFSDECRFWKAEK
jgi:ubiquinone/menaquinone biosynthesis C-methylase UbiE